MKIKEEIKKQKERMAEEGADEATSNINLEFLSSKLKDIGDEKIGLEDLSKTTFNELFKLQEDSKPSSEKDMDQKEFNIGGKVYTQDQIIGIANKFGVDKDRALGIVKKMEGGGPVEDRREVLIAQARGLGYEGDLSPENIEKNIGEIQKFLAKKNPQAIIDYFKGPDERPFQRCRWCHLLQQHPNRFGNPHTSFCPGSRWTRSLPGEKFYARFCG